MSPILRVTVVTHPPLGILICKGEVDACSVGQLKEAADGLLGGGCSRLLFELSGVTYMDSTGIGLMVECYHRLRQVGGTVELVGCGATILRVLEITRLKTYFRLLDSVTEALPALPDLPDLPGLLKGASGAVAA